RTVRAAMRSPRRWASTTPTSRSGARSRDSVTRRNRRPPAPRRRNERTGRTMSRGMTGFGRAQGQAAWGAWVWEARSVNGKSVDLRTNFPPGCEAVDFEARRRVKDRFARGSFQLQLRIDWTKDAAATAIDTRELARLARLSRQWSQRGSGVTQASFDG